jgi:hypothetical protein
MKKVIESLADTAKNKKENKETKNREMKKTAKICKQKILCSECKELSTMSDSHYESDYYKYRKNVCNDIFWKNNCENILMMPNKYNMNSNIESYEMQSESDTITTHPRIKNFCSNENDFINYKYDYVLNKFN